MRTIEIDDNAVALVSDESGVKIYVPVPSEDTPEIKVPGSALALIGVFESIRTIDGYGDRMAALGGVVLAGPAPVEAANDNDAADDLIEAVEATA